MHKVALVGLGRWGKILAKNLVGNKQFNLVGVHDKEPKVENQFRDTTTPTRILQCYKNTSEVFEQHDNVIIATPAATHFDLLAEAREYSVKNVLIEKPLALKSEEAYAVSRWVQRREINVMVDDTYRYHSAMRLLPTDKTIKHILIHWHNCGPRRPDCSVVWDVLYHPISFLNRYFPIGPNGCTIEHVAKFQQDAVNVHLKYDTPNGPVSVCIDCSWIYAKKFREIVLYTYSESFAFRETNEDCLFQHLSDNRGWGDYKTKVLNTIRHTDPPIPTMLTQFSRMIGGNKPVSLDHDRKVVEMLEDIDLA